MVATGRIRALASTQLAVFSRAPTVHKRSVMNCSLDKDFLFEKVKLLDSAVVGEKSVELVY